MDNSNLNQPETDVDTKKDAPPEPIPEDGTQSEPETGFVSPPETETSSYVNEKIMRAYNRGKSWIKDGKERYLHSPRLQKVTYQGKFLPAFWTVTAIISLLVNIILIAVLASFGRYFFEFKSLVADGLVNGLSDNLALMDKAHIVTTIPVETTVQLQDDLPVSFDVPLKQATVVTLTSPTVVDATTYINGALVPLNVTLPMGTPLQLNLDMTLPVSQSIPLDLTVPVTLQVPLDIAVDQTDLHQSIVGLQSAIEPYKTFMGTTLNSSAEIPMCTNWWSGWLCQIFLGKP